MEWRSRPPLRVRVDRDNRRLIIPTARTAEAKYNLYWRSQNPPILAHGISLYSIK